MNQVYNHAIANPEDLNQYEPFSPEVRLAMHVACMSVSISVCALLYCAVVCYM